MAAADYQTTIGLRREVELISWMQFHCETWYGWLTNLLSAERTNGGSLKKDTGQRDLGEIESHSVQT